MADIESNLRVRSSDSGVRFVVPSPKDFEQDPDVGVRLRKRLQKAIGELVSSGEYITHKSKLDPILGPMLKVDFTKPLSDDDLEKVRNAINTIAEIDVDQDQASVATVAAKPADPISPFGTLVHHRGLELTGDIQNKIDVTQVPSLLPGDEASASAFKNWIAEVQIQNHLTPEQLEVIRELVTGPLLALTIKQYTQEQVDELKKILVRLDVASVASASLTGKVDVIPLKDNVDTDLDPSAKEAIKVGLETVDLLKEKYESGVDSIGSGSNRGKWQQLFTDDEQKIYRQYFLAVGRAKKTLENLQQPGKFTQGKLDTIVEKIEALVQTQNEVIVPLFRKYLVGDNDSPVPLEPNAPAATDVVIEADTEQKTLKFEERLRLRNAWKEQQEIYNSQFENRGRVRSWLGLNPKGFDEVTKDLNEAKRAYAVSLQGALLARAKKQEDLGVLNRLQGEAFRGVENRDRADEISSQINSGYRPYFTQRFVIDDAQKRMEARGELLSEDKKKLLKNLGETLKRNKWKLRIGSVVAAGAVATAGVALSGGTLLAAVLTGGGAALSRGARMGAGIGAAMGAGALTHRLMDNRVGDRKDTLIETERRIRSQSYDELIQNLDGITAEYFNDYGKLRSARTQRNVAAITAAAGAGLAVGLNTDQIVESIQKIVEDMDPLYDATEPRMVQADMLPNAYQEDLPTIGTPDQSAQGLPASANPASEMSPEAVTDNVSNARDSAIEGASRAVSTESVSPNYKGFTVQPGYNFWNWLEGDIAGLDKPQTMAKLEASGVLSQPSKPDYPGSSTVEQALIDLVRDEINKNPSEYGFGASAGDWQAGQEMTAQQVEKVDTLIKEIAAEKGWSGEVGADATQIETESLNSQTTEATASTTGAEEYRPGTVPAESVGRYVGTTSDNLAAAGSAELSPSTPPITAETSQRLESYGFEPAQREAIITEWLERTQEYAADRDTSESAQQTLNNIIERHRFVEPFNSVLGLQPENGLDAFKNVPLRSLVDSNQAPQLFASKDFPDNPSARDFFQKLAENSQAYLAGNPNASLGAVLEQQLAYIRLGLAPNGNVTVIFINPDNTSPNKVTELVR